MTDGTHPGVTLRMAAQVLDNWLLRGVHTDRSGEKSHVYFGFPQGRQTLHRVAVSQDDKRVVAAFPDRNATRQWAKGNLRYFDRYSDVERHPKED